MHPPPDPQMRRAATLPGNSPKSHPLEVISNRENTQAELDLQARKIRQLFFFCHATARTIATLAYGVAR